MPVLTFIARVMDGLLLVSLVRLFLVVADRKLFVNPAVDLIGRFVFSLLCFPGGLVCRAGS